MNIKRWIRRWLEDDSRPECVPSQKEANFDDNRERTIRFSLTPAIGGRILSTRRWVPSKSEYEDEVYVISTGEDVGARVTKIVNLEIMK